MDQKEAADVVAPLPAVGSLRPSFYQLTSHLSDPSAVSQVQGDQEIIVSQGWPLFICPSVVEAPSLTFKGV